MIKTEIEIGWKKSSRACGQRTQFGWFK